jgi:membrane protein required for colicin V production
MTWLDYGILAVLAVSMVWSALRGVVREIVSLGGWIIAFLAANLFAGPLAAHLPQAIPGDTLRTLAAFLAIFILALICSALVGMLMSKLVSAVGLGPLDRALGALFGIARGLLLVLVAVIAAGLTSAPQQAWWKESMSGGPLKRAALALKPWLPDSFAQRLRYD